MVYAPESCPDCLVANDERLRPVKKEKDIPAPAPMMVAPTMTRTKPEQVTPMRGGGGDKGDDGDDDKDDDNDKVKKDKKEKTKVKDGSRTDRLMMTVRMMTAMMMVMMMMMMRKKKKKSRRKRKRED